MNMKPNTLRSAVPVLLSFLCAACGGNPPQESVVPLATDPAGGGYLGTSDVYANLISERGGSWAFTTVAGSDAYFEKGYMVRLNDLSPAFDTRVAECMPQVYPEGHRCSPTHPFRDKDSGMLDKIINGSIAVGTAGKVTNIKQTYETEFNEAEFNRAVDEGLVNTGLDVDRRQLVALIEKYDAEVTSARLELSQLTAQMSETRNRADRVELEVQPTMNGLTAYYQDDIDFTQLVDLSVADGVEKRAFSLGKESILPCDARRCTTKAQSAMASLQQEMQGQREWLAEMTEPTNRVYNVHCDNVSYGDYLLDTECPAQVVVSPGTPTALQIGVTILSRDFGQLYPSLDLADDHLRVTIEGQSVTFSNLTPAYVTLTAETLYYNSIAHNTEIPIDLAPGISVTKDMGEFASQVIDIESSYRQMTPDKAAGASFQFGFAVRYRVSSQPEEQTLHDLQTYNAGCVIENALRPGSCEATRVADASESIAIQKAVSGFDPT
jgi:hypothetical protein